MVLPDLVIVIQNQFLDLAFHYILAYMYGELIIINEKGIGLKGPNPIIYI